MNARHKLVLLLAALAFASLALADLRFDLEPGVEHVTGRGFCIDHRIPANSLVTGSFFAEPLSGASPPRILATIYDAKGDQPFSRPDLTGEARFSFRSPDVPTDHSFCFRLAARKGAPANVPAGSRYPVRLEVKYDYDLFDEQLAHDFKVKPVETEFIRLEETMRRVAAELSSMVHNEVLMRTVNESTFERVTRFAILSTAVLVAVSLYQVYYLKRFFRSKKLI